MLGADVAEQFGTPLDPQAPSAAVPTQPFGFAGEATDPTTGGQYLRARQYNPGLGRFSGVDALDPSALSSWVSPYAYVGGRPGVLVDPSGMCWDHPSHATPQEFNSWKSCMHNEADNDTDAAKADSFRNRLVASASGTRDWD